MALPVVSVSPLGGTFTDDTVITITASRASTIFYCMWPLPWAKTATGQTSVQVTATESGSLRVFCIADDTKEWSWSRNYSFNVRKPGGRVTVYNRLGRQEYATNTRLTAAETGGEWVAMPGQAPMYINPSPGNATPDNAWVYDLTSASGYYSLASGLMSAAASSSARNGNPFGTAAGPAGSIWNGAAFPADQQAFACINVPFDGWDQWIGARLGTSSASGYILAPYQASSGAVSRNFSLFRLGTGGGQIGEFSCSLTYNPDDFTSFDGLIVTGTNPVRIRVVSWIMDALKIRQVPDGRWIADYTQPYYLHQPWGWVSAGPDENSASRDADGDGYGDYEGAVSWFNPPTYANAANISNPGGTFEKRNIRAPEQTNRSYFRVLGEVLDSSPYRATSGQPGIGSFNGAFDLTHFYASDFYELTASAGTPSGGLVTLSGSRVPSRPTISITRR